MFKKIFSLLLAIIICSTAFIPAFAENGYEPDFPCGGVIEGVEVRILYAPLKSRILYGDFGLSFSGMVLKITYPDGESEIVSVKEYEGTSYTAGEFELSTYLLRKEEQSIKDYGFVRSSFSLHKELNHGGYSAYPDFTYINIPTPKDIFNYVSSLFSRNK